MSLLLLICLFLCADISQHRVQQSEVQAVAGASGSSSSSSGGGGGGGGTSAGGAAASTSSSDNPAPASKKSGASGGAGSSVMDRIKSPGTVRRLSMKMRKLPELRRKLSLRSSRSQRHANGQGGSGANDDASPPNARKESSNNVISRYHLDSSAPPARRRASRARSADKGGYLSDGDSPELLPKQGGTSSPASTGSQGPSCSAPPPPSHQTGQEATSSGSVVPLADAGTFRMYSLADQPRCAQRMSGLLTVHLLGVEELTRSQPRADAGKEVFCAIQVDGVTRARTALLTCRGATLPLNHTFNLELERARLLKLVVLTPVTGTTGTAGTGQPTNGSVAPTRNRVCCLGAVAIPPLFRGESTTELKRLNVVAYQSVSASVRS